MTAQLMESAGPASVPRCCPGCGSTHIAWVATGVQDNFLCKTCGACWYPAAGHTERVNPQDCPGCGLRRVCAIANG